MQKITFILAIISFLTGCSVARKTAYTETDRSRSAVSLYEIEKENLNKINFDIIKAEISYRDEENREELIAAISYRKDWQYLISLRTRTGFEVGRVYINRDTLLANDRLNRKFYYGSALMLAEKYGIEAEWLPIIFGDLSTDTVEKELSIDCRMNEAKYRRKVNSGEIIYSINCKEGKVILTEVTSQYGRKVFIKFGNFVEEKGKKYPADIQVTDNERKTEINIKIRKMELDTDRLIRFIPGEGYKRIIIR